MIRDLITSIVTSLDIDRCDLESWIVDPLDGPVVSFLNVESYQPSRTLEDGENLIARWTAMGAYADDHVANLRRGLKAGKVAVRAGVAKVIDQIDDLMRKTIEDWPLLKPLQNPQVDWPEAHRAKFRNRLTTAVRDRIRPALLRCTSPTARPRIGGSCTPTRRSTCPRKKCM